MRGIKKTKRSLKVSNKTNNTTLHVAVSREEIEQAGKKGERW